MHKLQFKVEPSCMICHTTMLFVLKPCLKSVTGRGLLLQLHRHEGQVLFLCTTGSYYKQ